MTALLQGSSALSLATALLAGIALGRCYLAALRRSVTSWTHAPSLVLVALALARVTVTAAVLVSLAWLGMTLFVAASLGFLLARTLYLSRVQGVS